MAGGRTPSCFCSLHAHADVLFLFYFLILKYVNHRQKFYKYEIGADFCVSYKIYAFGELYSARFDTPSYIIYQELYNVTKSMEQSFIILS